MSKAKSWDLKWRYPAGGALAAVILSLPTLVWGNDAGAFFGSIPLAILIVVILLAVALAKVRYQSLSVGAMLCIFLIIAYSLFRSADHLRTTTRWLVHSNSYKLQVLNQPASSDGSLKHIEWDGWGFPGAGDTTVYLVNDPSDGIATASKKSPPLKLRGIPCDAVRVHRLETHWYTVLFYTDTDWTHCA